MHIPDGYLSPETTLPAFAVMSALWYISLRKIKLTSNPHLIPNIALLSAFSFVIMMFNVPVAGGSSAHAVGAVLVAILIGPWAAVLAISITLIIQALIFGDGGILAIGINCFNMAFIMSFCGYGIYRFFSGKSALGSAKNLFAVFIAAYIGINCAAIAAGIEMGIQPIFFTSLTGAPLYSFYPLSITVPAMIFAHSLFAGPIDGIVSAMAISYIVKFAPNLLLAEIDQNKTWLSKNKKILLVLIILIILSPLGLIASGTAYGEWSVAEVKNILGYVPSGMYHYADNWHALIPDYSLPKLGDGLFSQSVGYVISAVVGVTVIFSLILLSAKLTNKTSNKIK